MTSTFMKKDYAKAFRIIRAAYGLSQAELAQRMQLSASQLSLIEAGRRQPSLRVVDSLASAMSVPSALVTLLASSPEDLEGQGRGATDALSSMLLNLLVSASGKSGDALDETDSVSE